MEDDKLHFVMDAFIGSIRYFKPHRVGVLHPIEGLTNIISQTDVIQFAMKNLYIFSQTRVVSFFFYCENAQSIFLIRVIKQ